MSSWVAVEESSAEWHIHTIRQKFITKNNTQCTSLGQTLHNAMVACRQSLNINTHPPPQGAHKGMRHISNWRKVLSQLCVDVRSLAHTDTLALRSQRELLVRCIHVDSRTGHD